MGAQLQTLTYPTASKLFLYSNAFMAKSDVQKRDEQRATQTKNLNIFGHPGGG